MVFHQKYFEKILNLFKDYQGYIQLDDCLMSLGDILSALYNCPYFDEIYEKIEKVLPDEEKILDEIAPNYFLLDDIMKNKLNDIIAGLVDDPIEIIDIRKFLITLCDTYNIKWRDYDHKKYDW